MSVTRSFALALALLVLGTSAPFVAHAQTGEASASMSAAARDLYQQGVTAAREDRLGDAIAAFERSYALSPRDATLLNLAQVQEQSGRWVAGLDSYRRFLARADADMLARYGERARAAVAQLEPRIAHVTIVASDVGESDEVVLDGTALAPESLGVALPVDPGTHVVLVRRGDGECARQSVTLPEGGRQDVALRAACALPAIDLSAPSPADPAHGDDTPLWIGLGVGGGVVIAGVAIVLAVVLSPSSSGPMPFVGNVGPGTYTAP